MEFEWDEAKADGNLLKHGVRFDEAIEAFFDPDALEFIDARRNYGEERAILIGQGAGAILLVIYTERGTKNRIISARRASRNERENYHRQKAR